MQKYVTASSTSRHARLKLLGYYAQRIVTSRTLRQAATRAVIAGLAATQGSTGRARRPAPAPIGAMPADGYLRLGRLLSERQCMDMRAWLRKRAMVAARGSGHAFTMDDIPAGTRFGDYPLDTVVNCPHVMELANRPEILGMAAAYLGYTPRITLVGLRWSFPVDAAAGADNVQQFHRDTEPGSIKLMVYLTDVDEGAGPHSYVAGTHRDRMPLRLRRYADDEILRRHGAATVITGPAGTGFAIDTKGIHRGIPPAARARLVLVIQYALLPFLLYEYAPATYSGAARLDPYINCLVADAAGTGTGVQDPPPAPAPQREAV